jgi:hypothetical protein
LIQFDISHTIGPDQSAGLHLTENKPKFVIEGIDTEENNRKPSDDGDFTIMSSEDTLE